MSSGTLKMGYNNIDDLTSADSPINGTTVWNYDAIGRLASMNRGGNITVYKYDKESNLEYQTDENGIIIRYFYTPAGFFKEEQTDVAASCHCPMHQITFPSQPHPIDEVSNGLSIKYRYDESGKRTGLSFPDGRDIRYEYSSAVIGIYQNSSGLKSS